MDYPLEWSFLMKASDWANCYCEICRPRFKKYAKYLNKRFRVEGFGEEILDDKPVTRPTPLCRPYWAYFLQNNKPPQEVDQDNNTTLTSWDNNILFGYTYKLVPARPNCADKWKSVKVDDGN